MHRGLTAERLPQLALFPKAAGRQRRLTVLVRLLLLIPQFIALWVLGIVTFFVAIAAWFAALVLGRLPEWAANFLSGYVAYYTRVYASMYLLIDSYPPFAFSAPESPVQVELHPGELNRLAVFFRIILVIPAAIVAAVVESGWHALAFFCWLTVLIMGRTPEPLFDATSAILRYSMRMQAYFLMLSSSYPKRLFGDGTVVGALPPGTVAGGAAGIPGTYGAPEAYGSPGTPGLPQDGTLAPPAEAGPWATPPQADPAAGPAYGEPGAPGSLPPYTGPQEAGPQAVGPRYAGQPGAGLAATGAQGAEGLSPTRPLLMTTGAKVLLGVFIVAGLLAGFGSGFGSGSSNNNNNSTTVTTSSSVQP
jgi:hypothetical protein